MIRHLITPVLLLAGPALLPAAPAVPLVNLVDERTLVAVSVTDAPALLRGWDSGPLARTWADPQFAKFLAPLRDTLDIEEWDAQARSATGHSIRELLELAEGEALFALPSISAASLDAATPPPFLLALEIGGQGGRVRKIIADAAARESVKQETETFSGVEVSILPLRKKDDADGRPESIAWAITDGIWLLSPARESVFAAIDALRQGGVAAPLGKNERFQRTRERVGDAQGLFYVNTPAIQPVLRDAVAAKKAGSGGAPSPLGIDPEAVLGALGLEQIGDIYLGVRTDERETVLDSGFLYSGERGLLKLLAYRQGPLSRPAWIGARWPSVSLANFSIPQAYQGIEELLESVSPVMSGMAQGYIRNLNKSLGIDLKRDLIGSLGESIVSAYAIPAGTAAGAVPSWTEMDQLYAISLVNEAAFVKSVDALKKMGGPGVERMFEKRDYLGHELHSLSLPAPGPGAKGPRGFSYAIANGTLFIGIGSAGSVETALQGLSSGQGLFWKRDDVQAALADTPDDAVALQVHDVRLMLASLIEMAVEYQKAASTADPDGDKFVDVFARPDAETIARYWGLVAGHAVKTREGLFSKTRIVHP